MGEVAEVFFLPMSGRGQRLALHHRPTSGAVRGAIVYVHPMAEEMNKSRRMAALQARAFARAGYAVLQIDLLGCGDSSGDFGDAGWADWVSDIVAAAAWLRERHDAPLTLWGLRAGCLIAAEAAQCIETPADFVFWQPTPSGKLVLQQFLRLRLATEMQGASAKALMESLRSQLMAGEAVEVAGYRLSPALAAGLERASLLPPVTPARVTWLEVSTRDAAALLPASATAIGRWQQAGCHVHAAVAQGPSFWQTTEIEEAPALIDATLAAACLEEAIA
ncbi:MAG: hydrolase 2, exosortase A system-associated [Burkholderiaceae bacterium]|nr:hydrolase 2, exosortase A system-associated [Burkholderiaceae bacterium]